MERFGAPAVRTIGDVLALDAETRRAAEELIAK